MAVPEAAPSSWCSLHVTTALSDNWTWRMCPGDISNPESDAYSQAAPRFKPAMTPQGSCTEGLVPSQEHSEVRLWDVIGLWDAKFVGGLTH